MKLILASKSPRRRKLIEQLGYEYELVDPAYDDSADNRDFEHPIELVKEHAKEKALSVALEHEGIVIGADTVVYFDGTIFGKPKTEEEARKILTILSGNWHEVITGIVLIDTKTKKHLTDIAITKIKFKTLSEKWIDDYVATGEPFEGAGGYLIQEKAKDFLETYEGEYENLLGFPIKKIKEMLKTLTSSE